MKAALRRKVSAPKPQCRLPICVKPVKLEMNTIRQLAGRRKAWRSDSSRPLIENNNDIQDGYERAGTKYNRSAQNSLNTHEDRHRQSEEQIKPQITYQELAELLHVAPDANTEDGSCCSVCPEPKAGQQLVVPLIQRYVSYHLPKPPADVDQNLHQHLLNVQKALLKDLMRLGPLLQSMGFIECYFRQTLDHIDDLHQNISSPRDSLVLMKWVLHTLLSPELLGHPDLQEMDPIKKVDLLLFTEWVGRAKDKLLENVQKKVKGCLEKILHYERDSGCDDELYLDTIQCIDAKPKEAHKISPTLSYQVKEVCFQELLMFLTRYTAEQTVILGNKAKTDKPETKQFIRTLNNCHELKQYVQTNAKGIKKDLLKETVATLENMEAFTSEALMKIIADIATSHLKKYFKSENKEFFLLVDAVKNHFSELKCCQDVQNRVMDEAYKLITHLYLEHLIRTSQSKLRRCWNPDVGQTVAEDAELLHITILDLAPGVRQWNLILLSVKELLECESPDAMKITVGRMYQECWSEDLELPTLLRWKGLSSWKIREVQKALEDLPGYQPRPKPVCCFPGFSW